MCFGAGDGGQPQLVEHREYRKKATRRQRVVGPGWASQSDKSKRGRSTQNRVVGAPWAEFCGVFVWRWEGGWLGGGVMHRLLQSACVGDGGGSVRRRKGLGLAGELPQEALCRA